jgi:hypothetical protein
MKEVSAILFWEMWLKGYYGIGIMDQALEVADAYTEK